MKLALGVAVPFVFLGAAGCADRGANSAGQSIATAQTITAVPPAVSFAQADLNGDARIDRHEFELWRRQAATAGTGFAAAGGTSADDAFSAADTNVNGVLTLDEWQAMTVSPSAATAPAASRGSTSPGRPSGPPAPAPAVLGR